MFELRRNLSSCGECGEWISDSEWNELLSLKERIVVQVAMCNYSLINALLIHQVILNTEYWFKYWQWEHGRREGMSGEYDFKI